MARLIRSGQPYLTRAWQRGAWTLYAVADASPVVSGATMVNSTDLGITLGASSTSDVLIRVHWSRWLTVRAPALA